MSHLDRIVESLAGSAGAVAAAAQDDGLLASLDELAGAVCRCLRDGGKVLLCGNGVSAADCQHLAGELVGRFRRERQGFAAISLATDTSVMTAIANDYGYDQVFSRQVEALAKPGDVVMGFSTSGTSGAILRAMAAAKELGAVTAGWTGSAGAELADAVDIALRAPAEETRFIQDIHGALIHALCEVVEAALAGD